MRCNQCWKPYSGKYRNCPSCRKRLRLYSVDREAYLATREPRRGEGFREDAPLRVRLTPRSNNTKLRGLPVAISSPSTCPTSCELRGQGCFAEYGKLRHHWERTPAVGEEWEAFLARVRRLPHGQIWRYGEAGDLPGSGDELDVDRLAALVDANAQAGARGFTYTHKPLRTAEERRAVARANERGFAVNLSSSRLTDVPRLQALGIGPVVTVVSADAARSPDYVLCPADTHGLTCARCKICVVPSRRCVVAFPAHGQFHRRVSEIATS